MQSHPQIKRFQSLERNLFKQCIFALVFGSFFVLTASAWAQRNVIGPVSGVWDDSLYLVTGDIYIEQNASLTIQPGVIVRFEGMFWFDVYGLLRAQGAVGREVTMYSDSQWRGIRFHPESSSNSIIENCSIRSAYVGIECERAFVTIRLSTIDARSIGIKCVQSSPNISGNKLIRASGYDAKAISIVSDSSPLINDNQMIEAVSDIGNAAGIWIDNSTASIENNWIEVVSPNNNAIGIYAYRSVKVFIKKNIVRIRAISNMRNIWLIYSVANIISNDLFLMTTSETAICIHVDQASTAQITNNIIYGNGISIGDRTDADGEIDEETSGYNDYYLQATNHIGEWQGNEDITADPLFVRHSRNVEECDYTLTLAKNNDNKIVLGNSSPCIDAGSPRIHDDIEYNTPSDIGRFSRIYNPADLALSIDDQSLPPVTYNIVNAFPNPFNRSTTLTFNLALPGQASIIVFDLNGRQLTTLWNGVMGKGINRLVWSAEGLSAGEYLIRFELPGSVQTQRVLFLP